MYQAVMMMMMMQLRNDPGKVESNFFCYAVTVLSPHRNVLIFAKRTRKGGLLCDKMHLLSISKGCFYV